MSAASSNGPAGVASTGSPGAGTEDAPRPRASGPGRSRTGSRARPSRWRDLVPRGRVVATVHAGVDGHGPWRARRRPVAATRAVGATPWRRTIVSAALTRSRARSRADASPARSRRSRASIAAAASTSTAVAAVRAARIQSSVSPISRQPRSAARRASADVAAPERERRRRQVERHGLLGIANGLELEQRLTQQSAGALAGRHLDLDGRQRHQRVEEVDAGRQPLERGRAHRPRLLPAAEQEQRIRRVARAGSCRRRPRARPPAPRRSPREATATASSWRPARSSTVVRLA